MSVDVKALEESLGEAVRALRIERGLTQAALAQLANVSVGAVKHLETGAGANVTTLVRVVRAMDATDWLVALAPPPQFDPFDVLERSARDARRPRRRARQRVR